MGKKKDIELALLSYAAERGSIDFLRAEGITPEFFTGLRREASIIFQKFENDGFVPTLGSCRAKWPEHTWVEGVDTRDVDEYKSDLREEYAKDLFLREMAEIKPQVMDGRWFEAVENLPAKMFQIMGVKKKQTITEYGTNSRNRLQYVHEKALANNGQGNTRLPSFSHSLMNEYFGGMAEGDLITYVARPGKTKTFNLLGDIWYAAYIQTLDALLVSLEMNTNLVGFRLDSFSGGWSNFNLRRGIAINDTTRGISPAERARHATQEHADAYAQYIQDMEERTLKGEIGKIHILTYKDLDGPITPSRIESIARDLGVDIVGVDYMSLVDPDSKVADDRLRHADVSRGFKKAAERLGIPFIVPHQLNREAEKAKKITLANFASADEVGRNVDIAIGLNDHQTPNGKNVLMEVIKARGGPDDAKFAWDWDVDTGVREEIDPSEINVELEDMEMEDTDWRGSE